MRGHWRGYEARFDGQHLHAIAVNAVAQSFQKDVERAFGSAVDIIALAATVAGYRGYDRQRAPVLGLEVVSQPGQEGNRGNEIGMQNGCGDLEIRFRSLL